MAISIKQWEEEAKKLTEDQRKQLVSAIKTLQNWEVFDEHYDWTGYTTIGAILKHTV